MPVVEEVLDTTVPGRAVPVLSVRIETAVVSGTI